VDNSSLEFSTLSSARHFHRDTASALSRGGGVRREQHPRLRRFLSLVQGRAENLFFQEVKP
jgi:hypothetical protein